MKCKIVTGPNNYNLNNVFTKEDNDFVIGADIGALMLSQNSIKFDLALGDFDSIKNQDLEDINQYAKSIKEYPIKKNYTDTYLAVEEALKLGYDDITIYGGIGKRIDHTFANLLVLKLGDIKIVTENEIVYVLDPGFYEIKNEYKYISFFAIEDVKNLKLQGFDYPLDDYELLIDDPLCISNKGKGNVEFTEGLLMVIHQNEY